MACIIIHSGLGKITNIDKRLNVEKLLIEIINQSYNQLMKNGARSAVVHAIKLLEDNPLFNAGTGSKLQSDGKVRMSASLMTNDDCKFNAIINISNVKNPIEIANKLHKNKHQILAADGAIIFSRLNGFQYYNPITKERLAEFKEKKINKYGTVGAVAIDNNKIICVGSSTGGVGNETVGRVSDTPTIAGAYVNNLCGVVTSGIGEQIINLGVASKICNFTEITKNLKESVQTIISQGVSRAYEFGLISLNNDETIIVSSTIQELFYASKNEKEIKTFNNKTY